MFVRFCWVICCSVVCICCWSGLCGWSFSVVLYWLCGCCCCLWAWCGCVLCVGCVGIVLGLCWGNFWSLYRGCVCLCWWFGLVVWLWLVCVCGFLGNFGCVVYGVVGWYCGVLGCFCNDCDDVRWLGWMLLAVWFVILWFCVWLGWDVVGCSWLGRIVCIVMVYSCVSESWAWNVVVCWVDGWDNWLGCVLLVSVIGVVLVDWYWLFRLCGWFFVDLVLRLAWLRNWCVVYCFWYGLFYKEVFVLERSFLVCLVWFVLLSYSVGGLLIGFLVRCSVCVY